MPFISYITVLVFIITCYISYRGLRFGWGIPMAAVLATLLFWYGADIVSNGYSVYEAEFDSSTLIETWWQILAFILSFSFLAPITHSLVNHRIRRRRSAFLLVLKDRNRYSHKNQLTLNKVAYGLFSLWLILSLIAVIRLKGDSLGFFAPYLGTAADPWSRAQIGGGFSALLSLAFSLQLFVVAAVGVVFSLSRNRKVQSIALLVLLLALPYYLFSRTRNPMIAVTLPGILSFVLIRMRSGIIWKGVIFGGFLFLFNIWMLAISNTRDGHFLDIHKLLMNFQSSDQVREQKHAGLNMFEELAWINALTKSGEYQPKAGARYYAELVNPIPRALWKTKPTIGLDYAIARGQSYTDNRGATTATTSTGLIGQGVVNFGPFFGPFAAAFLAALWVAVLARQDLLGADIGRLILFTCGLVLTFNIGRDITFLVLYPFIFGLLAYRFWGHLNRRRLRQLPKARRAPRVPKGFPHQSKPTNPRDDKAATDSPRELSNFDTL